MEIINSLLLALVLFTLFELIKIEKREEDIISMIQDITKKNIIEAYILEGIKNIQRNTLCEICVIGDHLQIISKEDSTKKFNIRLTKLKHFEILTDKIYDAQENRKTTKYYLIIQYISKDKIVEVISFYIEHPKHELLEHVNAIIKKDGSIDL